MTWTAEKETRWAPVFAAHHAASSAREAMFDAESDLGQARASGSGAAIMVAGAIHSQRTAEHGDRCREYMTAARSAEAADREAGE